MRIGNPFTVEEVLKRPIFQEAKVVAGHRGLRRPVRWVHVLEVTNVANLLHGKELILTTGIGLGKDEQAVLHYVQELVNRGVSGLCIELGRYLPEVPERVKQFADRHNFPLIVFERPVRFIDITQDIHASLINRYHHQMVELERISQQFLQLTLHPKGVHRILELLHEETGCPVRLQDDIEGIIEYPESFNKFVKEGMDFKVMHQPIVVMDTQVGQLSMIVHGDTSEYLKLILDRAATAIAQELLRRMSLEERRLRRAQRWMNDLLERGEAELPPSVVAHLASERVLVVAAIRPIFNEEDGVTEPSVDSLLLHVARRLPTAFEACGLMGWLAPHGNLWAVVGVDKNPFSSPSAVERLKAALEALFRRLAERQAGAKWSWKVGIGRKVNHCRCVPKAWRQAVQALNVQQPPEALIQPSSRFSQVTFVSYDDLHIWKLFLEVNEEALRQFVDEQIGALLAYDQCHGTELVKTLEVFLASGQSKQEAAKSLFIHRQTLYYRLEQISELLGEDWELPPRRLALETALAAYRYLEVQNNRSS